LEKHQRKDNDPLEEIKEWQNHRYDPGHYTGGNIHPILKAGRPNKYGYILLIGGVAGVVLSIFSGSEDPVLYWYYLIIQIGLSSLLIAAGLKLVISRRRDRKGKDR
jgi:hypothetical protein